MTKIINIFGAPGVGKSTYAALLFAKMKAAGFKCELVQEYAKELVYSDSEDTQALLNNQLVVLAEQYRRLYTVAGYVDYIITDSPLLMALVYNARAPHPYDVPSFNQICWQTFEKFDNLNIVLTHQNRPYQQSGRRETMAQSLEVEHSLLQALKTHALPLALNPAPDGIVEYLTLFEKIKALKEEKQKAQGLLRIKKLLTEYPLSKASSLNQSQNK